MPGASPNMSPAPIASRPPADPGPVVLALPEDMLRDEVEVADRPCVPPLAEEPDPGAVQALFELLKEAASPVAIVGGADWSPRASHHFANFAFRYGIPGRRRVPPPGRDLQHVQVYAGQLGYGPNPKLQQRIRDADLILAVGPRLGEATTDGYTLITPDHPGQTLVHVHPDPNELGRVYHADLPICADMGEFAEMVDEWIDPDLVRFSCGEDAHKEWLEWSEPKPRDGVKLDLGPCVAAMRERLPDEHDHLQRRRQFLGLVASLLALRPDADPARADQRDHGLRPSRRGCGRAPLQGPSGGLRRRRRRFPDERAGAGDRRAIWRRPARHPGRQWQPTAPSECTRSANIPSGSARPSSRTPISRRSPAPMAAGPRRSRRPRISRPRSTQALKRKGIRLLHCKTDVEQISNATTIAKLREKAKR